MKTTTSKAMSLKGNIKNLAKEKKVPPQIILQNFMFERFLQRLSLSEYRNNFIIKGGVLISCLVGLESRSTMDIDTTIKNYPLTEKDLKIFWTAETEKYIIEQISQNINNRDFHIFKNKYYKNS